MSGAKESRPALDALMKGAKRRRVDAVVCWKLDRLGRSLRHLLLTLDELTTRGMAFVTMRLDDICALQVPAADDAVLFL